MTLGDRGVNFPPFSEAAELRETGSVQGQNATLTQPLPLW